VEDDLPDVLAGVHDPDGIRPPISHVLGWDEVPEAVRVMNAGEHVGKVVLHIP